MPKNDTPAVLTEQPSGLMIFRPDVADQLAVVKENMGNQKLSIGDLDKITVPTGGGQFFSVPDMEKGQVPKDELEVLIIDQADNKAFWPKDTKEGGDKMPVCRSNDGLMGHGDIEAPGFPDEERVNIDRVCSDCPKNVFGSHRDGKRKACKDTKRLFLMFDGKLLPTRFSLPPTSLKNYRKYTSGLTSTGTPYWGVITKIGLTAEDKGGNATAIATFKVGRTLTQAERAQVQSFRAGIMPFLEAAKAEVPTADEAQD